MDSLPRALVFAAIILGSAIMIHGLYPADRFTMVPAPAGGGAFRVDRLTGGVLFCDALMCRQLPLAVPVIPRPAAPAPGTPGAATGT
ncbi:MAG: hypothetical protein WCH32_08370 [Pseudomonadota bacterium]